MGGVDQALLSDERRAHLRDDRHGVAIVERQRVDEPAFAAVAIKLLEIELRDIGASTATRSQYPGAHGERIYLLRLEVTDHV